MTRDERVRRILQHLVSARDYSIDQALAAIKQEYEQDKQELAGWMDWWIERAQKIHGASQVFLAELVDMRHKWAKDGKVKAGPPNPFEEGVRASECKWTKNFTPPTESEVER